MPTRALGPGMPRPPEPTFRRVNGPSQKLAARSVRWRSLWSLRPAVAGTGLAESVRHAGQWARDVILPRRPMSGPTSVKRRPPLRGLGCFNPLPSRSQSPSRPLRRLRTRLCPRPPPDPCARRAAASAARALTGARTQRSRETVRTGSEVDAWRSAQTSALSRWL